MELPGTATQRSSVDWYRMDQQSNGKALRREAKQWKSKARLSRGTAQSGDQLTGKGTAECSREKERRRADGR